MVVSRVEARSPAFCPAGGTTLLAADLAGTVLSEV